MELTRGANAVQRPNGRERYQLDVTSYLTDALRRLPALPPTNAEGLCDLLPDRWAKNLIPSTSWRPAKRNPGPLKNSAAIVAPLGGWRSTPDGD